LQGVQLGYIVLIYRTQYKQTKREDNMNIYQLNNLIAQLEKENHGMLDFYKNMRKDLMKTLSKGIQEIIDNQ